VDIFGGFTNPAVRNMASVSKEHLNDANKYAVELCGRRLNFCAPEISISR